MCNVRRADVLVKIGFVIVVALVAAGCRRPGVPHRTRVDPHVEVRVFTENRVIRIPLENYVRTVILSEVAPVASDANLVERMLEVQAIVSRTYALTSRHSGDGYDL